MKAMAADYGEVVEYRKDGVSIDVKYPDFTLHHAKQLQEQNPHPVVTEVFEVVTADGKKTDVSAVSAAGRRPAGPTFQIAKSVFQLHVTNYGDRHLQPNQVVVVKKSK
jgi:hypothetical protein